MVARLPAVPHPGFHQADVTFMRARLRVAMILAARAGAAFAATASAVVRSTTIAATAHAAAGIAAPGIAAIQRAAGATTAVRLHIAATAFAVNQTKNAAAACAAPMAIAAAASAAHSRPTCAAAICVAGTMTYGDAVPRDAARTRPFVSVI